ncbi:MFS transporter, YQGE family, putative transporter [Saccharicrinis carchari]|uniref:MFS transporter, YQGE family, putative transporter n=1 Tax=Saccharicrinis carchari TaxID=1168039 RepID=A0A521EY77_SACCC|nr:MFS transporter [Saccharicrinis carchari]SMO88845.1 MFS transporter, YQGE family, putative transporter [Saccharicrinis carchari]
MKKKLFSEYQFFLTMPRDMRLVLITNMIYAFVLPIIDIFVGAYIMRSSNDPSMVAVYQLCVYTGIPFTFLINGFLLKKINISHLYSFGMLLSGISMIFMMTLSKIDMGGVSIAGLIMGASFGFFWANRDFLTLDTTNDSNRNYYYGVETFFYTLTFIIVPAVVGWFIVQSGKNEWFDGKITGAYQVVTGVVILLTILASMVIHKEKFRNPDKKKFLYFRFDLLWKKMLALASLKGMIQGYLVTAPAILIMTLVGDEGTLGTVQSVGGILTAFILYILGRTTKPKHRLIIFTTGMVIFLIGALANQILFSAVGVIIFVLCKVLFMPLHDIAYFPIQMRVIDILSVKENRSEYAYIFNHEFGLYIGRFFGLVLFIVLALYVSKDFALRYALVIVALIQMISIPVAKNIINHVNKTVGEVKKDNPNLVATKLDH